MTLSYSTVQYKVVQVLKNTFPHHHRQAGRQKIAAIKYVRLFDCGIAKDIWVFFCSKSRAAHTLPEKKCQENAGFFWGGREKKKVLFL